MDGAGTGLGFLAVAALATRLGDDPGSVAASLIVAVTAAVGVFHDVRRRSWAESLIFSVLAGVLCGAVFAVVSSRVGGGGDVVNLLSVGAGILVAGAFVILLPGAVVLGRLINLGASAVRQRVGSRPQPEQ